MIFTLIAPDKCLSWRYWFYLQTTDSLAIYNWIECFHCFELVCFGLESSPVDYVVINQIGHDRLLITTLLHCSSSYYEPHYWFLCASNCTSLHTLQPDSQSSTVKKSVVNTKNQTQKINKFNILLSMTLNSPIGTRQNDGNQPIFQIGEEQNKNMSMKKFCFFLST